MAARSVVVVGAGVFGAWTALRLARDGWRVTLVEAYGPANGRSSSADHSRVMRAGYGALELYSRWATDSLAEWHWLAKKTGQPLVEECGGLFFESAGDGQLEVTAATLTALGITTERFDAVALAARYPQIAVDGLDSALFEARAGVIRARQAVHAVVDLARTLGVEYVRARVEALDETRAEPLVRTTAGDQLRADCYVLACGPWLPSVLPVAVGGRIRATRQEVLHFGVPPGDRRFGLDQLPVWIDFPSGIYGIPDLDTHGFKVGIDRHGPPIDPDTDDRLVGEAAVRTARAFLARRFPAMAAAPLLDARVCQYENTASGDFLIDRHPVWPGVWIAGGGSGHGFKHGPAVGAHVAELVRGGVEPLARFALAGKGVAAERSVF